MRYNLVIFYGPSCGGKSTIQNLLKELYTPIPTATTRKPRIGEFDGINYHFKSKAKFDEEYANGEIIERAEYLGSYYGAPMRSVKEAIEGNRIRTVILEINGVRKLKEMFGDKVLAIYIGADIESLSRRFRDERKTTQEDVENRIYKALNEELQPDYINTGDYVVWNNDGQRIDDVLAQIKSIIQ
ncbi:Guanylate kinase [compost metagenome]